MKYKLPKKYWKKYAGHREMSRRLSPCICPGCNKIRKINKFKFGRYGKIQ